MKSCVTCSGHCKEITLGELTSMRECGVQSECSHMLYKQTWVSKALMLCDIHTSQPLCTPIQKKEQVTWDMENSSNGSALKEMFLCGCGAYFGNDQDAYGLLCPETLCHDAQKNGNQLLNEC